MFLVDKKHSRLVSPRGRKFGVIDTPQNFIYINVGVNREAAMC